MKAVIGTFAALALFLCGAYDCSALIQLAGLSKQKAEAELGVVIRSEPITPNYSNTKELGISVEFVPKSALEDFLFAELDVYSNALEPQWDGHVGRQKVCSVTLSPLVQTKEKVRLFFTVHRTYVNGTEISLRVHARDPRSPDGYIIRLDSKDFPDSGANPKGGANGRQPFSSDANSTSGGLPPVAHPDVRCARAMWLYVDSPEHYFIEDLCDYRGFLRGIQIFLQPADSIVFSSWASRPDIRALLEQHQLEPDEHVVQERERLAVYRDDYPDAFAVRWAAKPALLGQLVQQLHDSSENTDFCDHVIAYGARGALLSFHDAFQGDPLIINGVVQEPAIRQFCSALGVTYKLQKRKELYDWSE